jgi:hypothetical protein
LLSLLLQASDPETGQAMNDRQIADNLLTFITAGHETTALALTEGCADAERAAESIAKAGYYLFGGLDAYV